MGKTQTRRCGRSSRVQSGTGMMVGAEARLHVAGQQAVGITPWFGMEKRARCRSPLAIGVFIFSVIINGFFLSKNT